MSDYAFDVPFEVRMARSIFANAEQQARRRLEAFVGGDEELRAKIRDRIRDEERKLFFGEDGG